MSFKFTLDREGKIRKIIAKILKSGAGLISEKFNSVKDDEEKSDRMLEASLRQEAVKILHNRRRDEVAKGSRKKEIRKSIIGKRVKRRRRNRVK